MSMIAVKNSEHWTTKYGEQWKLAEWDTAG